MVIVKCPKCANLHLIADRLGWFGEPGSVDQFLAEQGQGGHTATLLYVHAQQRHFDSERHPNQRRAGLESYTMRGKLLKCLWFVAGQRFRQNCH